MQYLFTISCLPHRHILQVGIGSVDLIKKPVNRGKPVCYYCATRPVWSDSQQDNEQGRVIST